MPEAQLAEVLLRLTCMTSPVQPGELRQGMPDYRLARTSTHLISLSTQGWFSLN